ncbi:MAG: UDP-2,4-diacetamido-2,4,6-trideoxy-beta-L-altropyranose hydrolase [Candidatus Omnitrophota bacterium]
MDTILIRVDAKKKIALGHLKRCLSLAQKFRQKGVRTHFLTANDKCARQCLDEAGFAYTVMALETDSSGDCQRTVDEAGRIKAGIVIIDSYEIGAEFRQRLMDEGFLTVSIDDIAHASIPSHVIINGNLNAEAIRYDMPEGTTLLLGINYLILGSDFWDIKASDAGLDNVDNILITMGGVDHYDLSTRILKILERTTGRFSITVIIGPYYDNAPAIEAQAGRMGKDVELVYAPSGLFAYMKACSLAFCAGGQTLYELVSLGRPTIGIGLWENQFGNVAELSSKGIILGIRYSDGDLFDLRLANGAARLINEGKRRQAMAHKGLMLIDGKGAERVCQGLISARERYTPRPGI